MNRPHYYIYDASAGSGKTYTITREYLCILLQQDKVFAFQNILAITFTNKAAAEMKQRIVKALVYFSGLDQDLPFETLLNDVASQTGLNKTEIQKKSLQVLKYLIPNYAGFEVSTIDSFNHRIIRTFAKDLKLSQNFEVEMEVEQFLKQAVEQLIDQVGIDEKLTSWLVDFVNYKIDRNKSGEIIEDLHSYAKLILNENNYKAIKQIEALDHKTLIDIKLQVKEHIKSIKEDLNLIAEKFFTLLNENNIQKESFFKHIISYFKNLREGKLRDKFDAGWNDIENHLIYNKSTVESQKQLIDAHRSKIVDIFLESKSLTLKYHINERILKTFVPLAMISEIQHHVNQIKAEEGILFINDFNRLIGQHIKHQPAPFIYERLGEKFRHYFIDEFQDTSKLQWQNLIPLIDNALSGQHDDGTSGHLYIVGDVKQSIYEWRGGDPQQFLALSQGQANPFSIEAEKEVLESNWRSYNTIVEFNNGFFDFAAQFMTSPEHKKLYENAKQNPENDSEGYVDIRFLPEQETKDLKHEQQVRELQRIIEGVIKQGYHLNDICILVRKNKYGSAIAEAFNELDDPIPVTSQESLLISSDVRVKLLSQFLELNQDFDPNLSIDFLLQWLSHTNYDSELYHSALSELKVKSYQDFIEALKDFGIDFSILTFERLSLYDKAEYALRVLDLDQNANAYIQFFLDEVFEFSISRSSSLPHFLRYWEDQKDRKSISTSETQNAVKIMTIHKSKGLEFPVVIYANANFRWSFLDRCYDWVNIEDQDIGLDFIYDRISKSSKDLSSSFDKSYHHNIEKVELADLNTAYVCMTRAIEQLYIVSESINIKGSKFEDVLLGYLKKKDLYREGKNHYTFGNQPSKQFTSNDTHEQIYSTFSSSEAQKIYDTLTADRTLSYNNEENLIYGKEIHEQLQQIKYQEDLDKDQIPSHSPLKEIVFNSDIAKYFKNDWEVYNEKDICYKGKILRPDRICIKDNEVVIIDYKTGKEEPSHLKQLTEYKEALEGLGFSAKTSILAYIRKTIYIKTL